MKLTTILIGGAALVGIGIYLSKKYGTKCEDDESVIYAEGKESYGEKLHKASLFAVGAIKTGADKIAEGIKDIRSQDMVKKGEETIVQAKDFAGDIVEDLKDMAVSINGSSVEDIDSDGDAYSTAGIEEETEGFFMPNLPDDESTD